MEPTDYEIALRVAKGEEQALLILNRRYFSDLVRYAHFKLGVEHNQACDLANETLFRAIKSLNRLTLHPNFHFIGYLLTILRNLVIDVHRQKSAREDGILIIDLDEHGEGESAGRTKSAIDERELMAFLSSGTREDERIQTLTEALSIFSEEEQELFMAYVYGISHEELRRRRGGSVEAARQKVHRLKKKFFREVARLTGQNAEVINERWQRSNSKSSLGSSSERKSERSGRILDEPD